MLPTAVEHPRAQGTPQAKLGTVRVRRASRVPETARARGGGRIVDFPAERRDVALAVARAGEARGAEGGVGVRGAGLEVCEGGRFERGCDGNIYIHIYIYTRGIVGSGGGRRARRCVPGGGAGVGMQPSRVVGARWGGGGPG